jgi:hypothetical protein
MECRPERCAQVIVESDKDRRKCMVQVNPFAGAKLPCWIAAEHGHSIPSVNPARAALHLINTVEFNTPQLIGNVTHKTSDGVLKGIMQTGLRNDFGKVAIWADA